MTDTNQTNKMAFANTVADELANVGMDLEDLTDLGPCLPENIREGQFKGACETAERMAKLAKQAADQYNSIAAAIRLEAYRQIGGSAFHSGAYLHQREREAREADKFPKPFIDPDRR